MRGRDLGKASRIGLVVVAATAICLTALAAQEKKYGRQSAFRRCWLVTKDLHQPLTLEFIRDGGNQCWRDFNRDFPI
jgi:hypothetical protein